MKNIYTGIQDKEQATKNEVYENVNRIKAKLNANETNDKLDSLLHNLSLETQIYVNNLNQKNPKYWTHQMLNHNTSDNQKNVKVHYLYQ